MSEPSTQIKRVAISTGDDGTLVIASMLMQRGLRLGTAAVRALEDGQAGVVVALQAPQVKYVPIAEAMGKLKFVPVDCDTIQTARDIGVSFGD